MLSFHHMSGIYIPKVGDDIYIDTILHLEHAADNIYGGLARVTSIQEGVSAGQPVHYVTVEGLIDQFNWETYLAPLQAKLKVEFADSRAHGATTQTV